MGDHHGIPGQLIAAFEKVIELANMPGTDEAKRKSMMDEILKDLDAIKLPDKP